MVILAGVIQNCIQNHTKQKGNRCLRVKRHDSQNWRDEQSTASQSIWPECKKKSPSTGQKMALHSTINYRCQLYNMIFSIMCLVSILRCMNDTSILVMISYITVLSVYTLVVDSLSTMLLLNVYTCLAIKTASHKFV